MKKNGQKISKTLFYRLKKEVMEKRGQSDEWLDYYSRAQFVEQYRKRIEEIELVHKNLLKTFVFEAGKQEDCKKVQQLIDAHIRSLQTSKLMDVREVTDETILSDIAKLSNNKKAQIAAGFTYQFYNISKRPRL